MHENFIDEKCPICSEPFAEDSDIVVCPECGAPYHRECYLKEGKCLFSEQHGEFEWQSRKDKLREHFLNIEQANMEAEDAENAEEENDSEDEFEEFSIEEEIRRHENYEDFKAAVDKHVEKMSGRIPERNGVNGDDIAQYVGKNAMYYLPVFLDIVLHNKIVKPNFAAFLFSPFHCFYRHMNLFGTLITIAIAMVYELRLLIAGTLSTSPDVSVDGAQTIVMIMCAGIVVLMVCMLLFFNILYLRTTIKRIARIKRDSLSKEEADMRIYVEGRPSLFNAIAYPLCIFFVMSVLFRMLNGWLGM